MPLSMHMDSKPKKETKPNCLRTINGCNKNTMVAVPNGTQQLRTAKHPKQPKICT